jgi:hypothetical protein
MIPAWFYAKKLNLILRLYEWSRGRLFVDSEIDEIIFDTAVEGLKSFVAAGGLDRDYPGAEGNAAEHELNQCHIYFTRTRSLWEDDIRAGKVEPPQLWEQDEKYFDRLMKVRKWLS